MQHAQVQHTQQRVPCPVFMKLLSCTLRRLAQVFETMRTWALVKTSQVPGCLMDDFASVWEVVTCSRNVDLLRTALVRVDRDFYHFIGQLKFRHFFNLVFADILHVVQLLNQASGLPRSPSGKVSVLAVELFRGSFLSLLGHGGVWPARDWPEVHKSPMCRGRDTWDSLWHNRDGA